VRFVAAINIRKAIVTRHYEQALRSNHQWTGRASRPRRLFP
jgi:hypothetical protein